MMITGAVTKNGLGIELTSTKSYWVSLYSCIATLADEHFLNQIDFPEQHSDFIMCLAYDIRKAYEGKRGVTVLVKGDGHGADYAMYSNRVLWPTFIVQVSMLKYLAIASKNLASIKLIENLEKCAFDVLHEVSPSTSSYIDTWFKDVVIDGTYLTQHLQAVTAVFVNDQSESQESRIYELPEYLEVLDPESADYQIVATAILKSAKEYNCSPYDIVSTEEQQMPEHIDW